LLVIRNNDAGVRLVTAQDHVTASLPPEYESGTFEGSANFSSGQISWELLHAE